MPRMIITAEDRDSIANALSAAASRWNEWADELASPEVAKQFREQAYEAEDFARQFRVATHATLTVRASDA